MSDSYNCLEATCSHAKCRTCGECQQVNGYGAFGYCQKCAKPAVCNNSNPPYENGAEA